MLLFLLKVQAIQKLGAVPGKAVLEHRLNFGWTVYRCISRAMRSRLARRICTDDLPSEKTLWAIWDMDPETAEDGGDNDGADDEELVVRLGCVSARLAMLTTVSVYAPPTKKYPENPGRLPGCSTGEKVKRFGTFWGFHPHVVGPCVRPGFPARAERVCFLEFSCASLCVFVYCFLY